jgi:hypothetical protein
MMRAWLVPAAKLSFDEYERNKRKIEQGHEGGDTTHKQATEEVIREAKRRKWSHSVTETAAHTSLLYQYWSEKESHMDNGKAMLL